MNFLEEQVLALAPDEASKKAGTSLAQPAKWVSTGKNDRAVWGECQGSGSKPYQTQVDLQNLAFKCSCPSRKFPCKHGIGLLLLQSRQPQQFAEAESPTWVSDWLDKRGEKTTTKKPPSAPNPANEAAQVKRLQDREASVEDGIAELRKWMKDILQTGLIKIPATGGAAIDQMTRRMIDAKAPGLAAELRTLAAINLYQEGWASDFLEQLARIYTIMCGFENRAQLPPGLLEDIRSAIGFTTSKEPLLQQTGVTDEWLILAKEITQEEQLLVERNWLLGSNTRRHALIVQFSMRGQGWEHTLAPGTTISAELVFYPSVQPLRALLKTHQQTRPTLPPAAFADLAKAYQYRSNSFALLPTAPDPVVLINDLRPIMVADQWWLEDQQKQRMPLPVSYPAIWKLLALSGANPTQLVIKMQQQQVLPMAAIIHHQYTEL